LFGGIKRWNCLDSRSNMGWQQRLGLCIHAELHSPARSASDSDANRPKRSKLNLWCIHETVRIQSSRRYQRFSPSCRKQDTGNRRLTRFIRSLPTRSGALTGVAVFPKFLTNAGRGSVPARQRPNSSSGWWPSFKLPICPGPLY
jgi:hypothetical protein